MAASKEMGCKLPAVVVDVRWWQPGVASMMWSWEMVWDESVGRSEGDSIMPWCMVHMPLFRSVRWCCWLLKQSAGS